MRKLLVFLCVVFIILGALGCNEDSSKSASDSSRFVTATLTSSNSDPVGAPSASPVPEPATMLMLGSGLIGIAVLGRKKFKK